MRDGLVQDDWTTARVCFLRLRVVTELRQNLRDRLHKESVLLIITDGGAEVPLRKTLVVQAGA